MGPSALTRLLWLGYLTLLQRLPSFAKDPPLKGGMLLPMCILCILTPHMPALWAGRVNTHACVGRLEASLLYFVILQLLLRDTHELWLPTHAALCLGWHAVHGLGRDGLHSQLLLQTTLGLYFVVFVPLLWSLQPLQPPYACTWPQLLMCDLSLVLLQASLRAYHMLWGCF